MLTHTYNMANNMPNSMPVRQAGTTLVEMMIGLAVSLIVVTSMVGLMSNSLGTTSRIIQMTQLSDELRNAMSMMSRDLRRANYNANAAKCFANSDCGIDGSANQTGPIVIDGNDCMIFNLDRNQDGDGTTDGAGGFRLATSGGVGYLEMWVGDASPACDDAFGAGDWIALTDPNFVDITVFNLDSSNSIDAELQEEGGVTLNQRTSQVQIQIEGQLVLDDDITRRIEDTIRVRNDFIWK